MTDEVIEEVTPFETNGNARKGKTLENDWIGEVSMGTMRDGIGQVGQ